MNLSVRKLLYDKLGLTFINPCLKNVIRCCKIKSLSMHEPFIRFCQVGAIERSKDTTFTKYFAQA